MNKLHIRGNGKKGVTPVIATIILIAGTLVLALVVGAYTFGLFGSNVKTVTLSSATLYGGNEVVAAPSTAYMTFSLNNPGSGSSISGMTLTGAGITGVSQWETASGASLTSSVVDTLPGGTVSSYTLYPIGTLQSITTGQTFNYVINFANGQSVSGVLTAQ